MTDIPIAAQLRNEVDLFANVDTTVLEAVVAKSTIHRFDPNEPLIEFGRPSRYLGVVLEGEVSISVISNKGEMTALAQLTPGHIFGEMSLMTGERAMADVIGVAPGRILQIPTEVFTSKLLTIPTVLQQLGKMLATRSREVAFDENRRSLSGLSEIGSDDPYGFALTSDTPTVILVINCGSSSLKYQLFDTTKSAPVLGGLVEQIGRDTAVHSYQQTDQSKNKQTMAIPDHNAAFDVMIETLNAVDGVSLHEIGVVGHRVVHGGEQFNSATIINDDVLAQIDGLSHLAPLHNPLNVQGIRLASTKFEHAVQVAVFDTSFHHTLPPYAYLYGLPYRHYKKLGLRRYGFHGTSHAYVSLKTAQVMKRPYNDLEVITCHLGNGSSMCAVDHGRSVDTTMGLTPTAGLMMGTRCGDVDPGALCHLAKEEGLDIAALETLINKESGLLGLSERSNDMRTLMTAADEGDRQSQLAIKTFCYQIRKQIGAYVAAMEGLDALVFTGGIGQNSAHVRRLATQGLGCMGIIIDNAGNLAAVGSDVPVKISTDASTVDVWVIPTDEERMIARQALDARGRFAKQHKTLLPIPIEVSAHHVHLSRTDVEALFGPGHELTPHAPLSQPGQFACKEQVTLVGPKGQVNRVRVLGPVRPETQVEISMTEQFKLGIHPPIRESGDVTNTPGLTLAAGDRQVDIDQGVICAMRHIHMTPKDALQLGVRDKYVVRVVVDGDRELTFGDVLVRVSPNYQLAMHIDTDEANAAHLATGAKGRVESIQSTGEGV